MKDFSENPAKIPALGFTHGGKFHADDVFSTALLKILRPDIRVYRGFIIPKGFSGIVFDIGDGEFDHHIKNSPRRENGVAYASLGLIWRKYGHYILNEEDAKRFDEKFIQPLDLDDNTGCGNDLAAIVASFNPVWDSEESEDAAFEEVVGVAYKLLYKKLDSVLAVERGKKFVEKHLKQMKDNVVILPQYAPWKPVLIPSDAEFVVSPSARGGYSVQCVPKDFNGKTGDKIPMPPAWRGKPADELVRLSGITDIRFCHLSGFMATCESLESAIAICNLARIDDKKRKEQSELDKRKNMENNKNI